MGRQRVWRIDAETPRPGRAVQGLGPRGRAIEQRRGLLRRPRRSTAPRAAARRRSTRARARRPRRRRRPRRDRRPPTAAVVFPRFDQLRRVRRLPTTAARGGTTPGNLRRPGEDVHARDLVADGMRAPTPRRTAARRPGPSSPPPVELEWNAASGAAARSRGAVAGTITMALAGLRVQARRASASAPLRPYDASFAHRRAQGACVGGRRDAARDRARRVERIRDVARKRATSAWFDARRASATKQTPRTRAWSSRSERSRCSFYWHKVRGRAKGPSAARAFSGHLAACLRLEARNRRPSVLHIRLSVN